MAGGSPVRGGGDSDTPALVAILSLITLAAAVAGVIWLAAAVDAVRAGQPHPGNPFPLARAILTGHRAAPSTTGWALAGAAAAAVLIAFPALVAVGVHRSHRGRQPVDAAAHHLARGRALRRLYAPAVLATARRLGSAVGDTPGPLLGRTVADRRPLYTSCEMVTLVVAGTRSGKPNTLTSRPAPDRHVRAGDRCPGGDLALLSTVTSSGSPHDVTLAELAVESFFPADERSRQLLRAWADAAGDPHR